MKNTIAVNRGAVPAADTFARPRVSWPTAPCRSARGADSLVDRPDKRVTAATGTVGINTTHATMHISTIDPYELGSPPPRRRS